MLAEVEHQVDGRLQADELREPNPSALVGVAHGPRTDPARQREASEERLQTSVPVEG